MPWIRRTSTLWQPVWSSKNNPLVMPSQLVHLLTLGTYSIINERRNHANFQLIIITHDENFLRKLGQNDVMEYYW